MGGGRIDAELLGRIRTRIQDDSFATEHASLADLLEAWLRTATFSEEVARHESHPSGRQG